jgi:thiamine-monophosphate kinase
MTATDPTVGELSEAQVLEAILRRIGPSSAQIGPGDDAAVLAAPDGRFVASVDTLVHGPDFRLAWSGGYDLGWKAAAVNLADIAAMGARPTSLLVALAMPDATPLSFVTALAAGLRAGCDALAPGCAVDGGDLTVSDTLTIAVTALGVLDGLEPVRRDGARPGDVVAIAGETGLAARGLGILFDRFRDAAGAPMPVDVAALRPGEADAITAQLRPTPPIGLGPLAARAGATAMMDVSDGLALDARRMATASRVTIDLASAWIGGDVRAALAGGEDHALLATFPPEMPLPPGFRAIGAVRLAHADQPLQVDGRGFEHRSGWDPYQDWDSARG